MSWINLGNNVFTRFIYEVTEPFLGIFRRLIQPRLNIPLDFSPVIAFLVLELIENILLRIIIAL